MTHSDKRVFQVVLPAGDSFEFTASNEDEAFEFVRRKYDSFKIYEMKLVKVLETA